MHEKGGKVAIRKDALKCTMETKEKILSNIEKINKRINPNSKKSIVLLDEDTQFKNMIDSIKKYVEDYNAQETEEVQEGMENEVATEEQGFPQDVYDAIYSLIEYSTTQFEQDVAKTEELSDKREKNIQLSKILGNIVEAIESEENWRTLIDESADKIDEETKAKLIELGRAEDLTAERSVEIKKEIEAQINNLKSSLHIEIDLERLNDRIKALSYIGVEVSEAFKQIKVIETVEVIEEVTEEEAYIQETTFEAKLTLWQRFKQSRFCRAIRYLLSLQVTIQPALPEGSDEDL